MTIDVSQQTVLVTGASSGIGASFARALAARGSDLVLVARRRDRLEALASELRAAHGTRVETVPFDLARDGAGVALRDEAERRGLAVTSLVNNAGFGTFGPFVGEEPDRIDRELRVDVHAPVQLTHAFLPQLLEHGSGFVINVASMAAYSPTPRMAVYGAAKAFVLSFTEALWAELRGTGVLAFALSPGATSTEFNSVVGTEDATAGARQRSPEQVVQTALAHLARHDPGPSAIDGTGNRIAAGFGRVLSRRTAVSLMSRLTDPGRRRDRRPAEGRRGSAGTTS